MKKTLKLILCTLLAASCALSFAACGDKADETEDTAKTQTEEKADKEKESDEEDAEEDKESDEEDDEKKKDSGEDEREAVVEAIMDAYIEYRYNDTNEYMQLKSESSFENADDVVEYYVEYLEEYVPSDMKDYATDCKPVIEKMVENMVSSAEYEITDVEENDDTYVYTIDMECWNCEDLIEEIDGVAADKDNIVDSLTKIIENSINESDIKTETIEIILAEEDGEWLMTPETFISTEIMDISEVVGVMGVEISLLGY